MAHGYHPATNLSLGAVAEVGLGDFAPLNCDLWRELIGPGYWLTPLETRETGSRFIVLLAGLKYLAVCAAIDQFDLSYCSRCSEHFVAVGLGFGFEFLHFDFGTQLEDHFSRYLS